MKDNSQPNNDVFEVITKIRDICDEFLQKNDMRTTSVFTVQSAYAHFLEISSHKKVDYTRTFRPVMLLIEEFAGDVDIFEITDVFISKFTKFLNEKRLASSTVNKYIKNFRLILEANNYQVKFIKPEKANYTEKIYLTKEELELFENCVITDDLYESRDIFLLACYTGLSFSDISKVGMSNIKEIEGTYVLSDFRKKTNQKNRIPLMPKALEILRKYQNMPFKYNNTLNRNIKKIARMAGINEPTKTTRFEADEQIIRHNPKYRLLSIHVARHTFATLLRQGGADIYAISKTLGHNSTKNTETYLHDTENQVIMDIMNVMQKEK